VYAFCFVLVFAFGERFMVLLLARSLQGLASACISVSGISFVFMKLQTKMQNQML
jgi:MFS family permease